MTHKEYRIIQLYNEINAFKGMRHPERYEQEIKARQEELNKLLEEVKA